MHSWLSVLEVGGEVGAVFFDLRRLRELLGKLRISLSSPILSWIYDYLTCREQKVVVGGEESKYKSVLSGLLQGSVLGPLLAWQGYPALLAGIQSVSYADDLLLFRLIWKDACEQQQLPTANKTAKSAKI